MLPTWEKLLQEDLHILVYSGDMDGILPTLGTLKWIEALKLDLVEPFQAWLAPNGEVLVPVHAHVPSGGPRTRSTDTRQLTVSFWIQHCLCPTEDWHGRKVIAGLVSNTASVIRQRSPWHCHLGFATAWRQLAF